MVKHEFLPFLYSKEKFSGDYCKECGSSQSYSEYTDVELTEDFGLLKKGDKFWWCRLSFRGFFEPLHAYFFTNDGDFEISFKIPKIQTVKES